MLSEIDIILLVIIALIGAMFAAVLRYVELKGKMDKWDFVASLLRGVAPAIVFVLGFKDAEAIGIWDYLTTFIGGAGLESLLKSVTTRSPLKR